MLCVKSLECYCLTNVTPFSWQEFLCSDMSSNEKIKNSGFEFMIKQIITWCFGHRPKYQPSTIITSKVYALRLTLHSWVDVACDNQNTISVRVILQFYSDLFFDNGCTIQQLLVVKFQNIQLLLQWHNCCLIP